MEKVAVVILNYLNYNDTIECIESVKTDKYKNKYIVVVDNNSSNESWKILNDKYKKSEHIHLIKTEKNLGFAKGNNVGIEYSRKVLNCDFVLLINNDTIIKDYNLITNLMNSYDNKVGIIGPRIISADQQEQNPVIEEFNKEIVDRIIINENSVKSKIKNIKIYKMLKKNKVLVNLKRCIFKNENKSTVNIISETEYSEDLILHGACMMLTKEYFRYYPYLYPGTFLYYEENILTLLTKKVGLKKMFINNTYIYHKEDQSSEMSFKNCNDIKHKYYIDSVKHCQKLFNMSYKEILMECFDE